MDELILKRLRREASEFEVRQLDHWRAESADNERAYREVERLWARLDETEQPATPAPPDVRRIVAAAEQRRRRGAARSGRRAVLASARPAWILAAAAVAAMIFMSVRHRVSGGPAGAEAALAPVQSSSGPGDVLTMSLSDGSVVRLGSETSVDFPPVEDRREVVLDGKAFFAVARGDVPFVVRTRLGVATAVGTRFEVRVDDELRLVVLEGVVRLDGPGGASEVGAGQVAYLVEDGPPRVTSAADAWALLDWAGGLLIFQATPLSDVVAELGRHFGREVRLTDAGLAPRRITAWFEDEPLEEVVSAVCLVAGARCRVSASEVTIGR